MSECKGRNCKAVDGSGHSQECEDDHNLRYLYIDPEGSGVMAFNKGVSNLDCPISRRTHANAACLWDRGWDKANKKSREGGDL